MRRTRCAKTERCERAAERRPSSNGAGGRRGVAEKRTAATGEAQELDASWRGFHCCLLRDVSVMSLAVRPCKELVNAPANFSTLVGQTMSSFSPGKALIQA